MSTASRILVALAACLVFSAPAQARGDRMSCAIKAAGSITVDEIVLECGLTAEEKQQLLSYLADSEAREKEMLRQQIVTQDLILRHIRQTDEFARMRAAGVTETALIELARRVSVDVQDPAQAFVELRKAVEIATKVQTEAKDNPSTDAFVAEVQRRVAALAADSKFSEANEAAEHALALWEADQEEQRRRGIELLELAFDQNMIAREFEKAAAKRVRIADLEAAGQASLRRLRSIAIEHRNAGLRYGASSDYRLAIAITNIALERAPTPIARGLLNNDKGAYFQELGNRTSGPNGTLLLAAGVRAYEAALTVRTRKEHPVDWATTQNNLANALATQGIRTGGSEGTRQLAAAVTAYRAALEIITRESHPNLWAGTQVNLAVTLRNQGTRTAGPDSARLLAEAVAAYRAALAVRNRDNDPVGWATTQNNLGVALSEQGKRTAGSAGVRLIKDAVDAYHAALSVRARTEHPVAWASTQNNLGIALRSQGNRTGGPDGERLLREAVSAYRAALEVYSRADHPVQWAGTQNNLGATLATQGTRIEGNDGARLLNEAVAAYRHAVEVYTRADQPVQWAETQENIALVLLRRAQHATTTDPRPDLEAALTAVEAALEVFDPEHMSYNHAKATRLRDDIRARLDGL